MRGRRGVKAWLVVAVLVVMGALGFVWLRHEVDSYDREYRKCMADHGTLFYPSLAYERAAEECK